MELIFRDAGDVKVVEFLGELGIVEASEAETQLKQIIDNGARKVLINMARLEFISSSGLRILLTTTQALKNVGGDLRLCGLNETVQEVFEISGFTALLMVFSHEPEALAGF